VKHPEFEIKEFFGYTPENNQDEMVWQSTKHDCLSNFAFVRMSELRVMLEELNLLPGIKGDAGIKGDGARSWGREKLVRVR
jgi:hypothetical protein